MEEVRNYINQVRRDFAKKSLDEQEVGDNPFAFFAQWIEEAINAQILDPYAMCVSTANAKGVPSSRIVYLRDFNEQGFVFYTNFESKKGNDIKENPQAALNFNWPEIERQVRISGTVSLFDFEKSDAYFADRPRNSQLGAWASLQSNKLDKRETLEERLKYFDALYKYIAVPRPPHWGGYLVKAYEIEFWQGRPNRLHDRICFELTKNGNWQKSRLYP